MVQHFPGILNAEPDWLSRQHDRPPELPPGLEKVRIRKLNPVTEEDFVMKAPGHEGAVWSKQGPQNAAVFESL